MRASRLLSLLIMLQLRGRLTAERLAQEFQVSVRTVYRDVDALSASGVPVYADRGPGGGFQLLDGYQTELTGLAPAEAEALFMIGMPDLAAALGLGPATLDAGRKLLASLPAARRESAERLHARFHLDPVDWYRAAKPVACLPEIAQAVLNQRMLAMEYRSWTTAREWLVAPLGLVLKAADWYMVARAERKIHIFKVANMRDACARETGFERPPDFDLPVWWASELARFEATLRPGVALLRASVLGLRRLGTLGAFAECAAAEADAPDARGWMRVRLPIETLDHAALLLLGIGPEIEVLAPRALRAKLRGLAERIAGLADVAALRKARVAKPRLRPDEQ